MERDALWRKVIEAKYGDGGSGWCTKMVLGTNGVSVQKSIRSGWLDFSKFLCFDAGDGTRVKFWEAEWCRDCSLKVAFPELYSISRNKEFLVLEVMQFSDGWLHWNILFRCPPQDWEEASIDFFLDMLYSTNVRDVGVDRLCWKPALSKVSEVRSFYHSLSLSSVIDFPWKRVWKSKVPPRVTFFTWTVASRKILTIDNLWNRHIAVKEWCFMCKRCWESVDHFLLQCPIAYELWSMVFCLFGIHWLMLYKVSELLASWQGKFGMH